MTWACRHSRGFTLIELIIASGIVAMLMSLALPSFGEALARARLQSVVEDLAIDIGQARLESLRAGAGPVHLSMQAGPAWCWAVGAAPDLDCSNAAVVAAKVVRASDYPGITMHAGQSAGFVNGKQQGTPALSAEFMSAQGQSLRVVMTPLGRAAICAPHARSNHHPRC